MLVGLSLPVWAIAFRNVAAVTVMTDLHMLAVPERREAYRRRTSVWVPWWPRRGAAGARDRH
jgi:hypothetical protein